MTAQKLLKFFFNNLWITGIILLFCVAISIYYLLLPENTELFINGYRLPFDNGKSLVITIFISGIFTNILINLFTGTLQKDKSSEENPQIPTIEIKNFVNTQTETQTSAENKQENGKFFPIQFFPDLKYFEGRENLLNKLKKTLEKEHRAVIHDISGIGKTFSTYKFAEKFQNNYDKIFFVRANREEMLSSLAEMGVLLNPSLENEPDQSIRANSFKDWLEKNEKWLVIYDNVDEADKLFPFVPSNLKGDCIFTSNFPLTENLAVNVNIEKLSESESKKLLFSRAKNKPHQKPRFSDEKEKISFEKIVKEIDGHPLALNTTGAFISKNVLNFQKFAKRLENEPNILIENEDGFDKYQRKSVLKAFSIAFEDISQKQPEDKFQNSSKLARNILGAVSFIAPEDIPEELLEKIFENLLRPQTFFQRLWSLISKNQLSKEKKEQLWQEVRLKILGYDLLKFDKSQTKLATHRLIQKVIELKLKNKEQTAILNITAAAIDELFAFSRHETKENCELYMPHAVVLVKKTEEAELLTEDIARIYYKIGRHLRETVKYNEAIVYLNKAVVYFRELLEKGQADLAKCFNELANVYESQGNYDEAVELYKQAIEIGEKTVGKEHPNYATRLNNLALVYRSQGKYDEAVELFKQAIGIDKKTIGTEHPDYASSLNNLALVYQSQGKYDEAIGLFKQAIEIVEKTIGKGHPDYAISLNNLALVYQSQGKYDEAIGLFKQAIKVVEKTNGKGHPQYANHMKNLAGVYESQGKHDEAVELFMQAIGIVEKTNGKEHPSYASSLNNLAYVYESQGKYDDALPMFEEALRICVKVLGEKHPSTLTVKRNLEGCRSAARGK